MGSVVAQISPHFSGTIRYTADTIRYEARNQELWLLGNASLEYELWTLRAPRIRVHLTHQVFSAWRDSLHPVILTEGSRKFLLDSVHVYFSSYHVIAYHVQASGIQQDLGASGKIIHRVYQEIPRGLVRADTAEVFFIQGARFSTCPLHPPHFSFRLRKAFWIPDKLAGGSAVSLWAGETPLPLWFPFLALPLYPRGSSGILLPSVGQSLFQGFVLRNLGLYFAWNDYVHAGVTADVYTSGTYRVSPFVLFRKRYILDGEIRLSFARTLTGYEFLPGTREFRDLGIFLNLNAGGPLWRGVRLRARVQLTTRQYWQNTSYVPENFLQNNVASGVDLTFPAGRYLTLRISLLHRLNTATGQVSMSLPQASIQFRRIHLLRLARPRLQLWITPSFQHITRWTLTDSAFFMYVFPVMEPSPGISRGFLTSGSRLTLPLEFSGNLFRVIRLSFRFQPDFVLSSHQLRPLPGFRLDTLSRPAWGVFPELRLTASTVLYGIFRIRSPRLQGIRHTFKPSIIWIRVPESWILPSPFFLLDSAGNPLPTRKYSPLAPAPVPLPFRTGTHRLRFLLSNQVDIRYRSTPQMPWQTWTLLPTLDLSTDLILLPDSSFFTPWQWTARFQLPGGRFSTLIQAQTPFQQRQLSLTWLRLSATLTLFPHQPSAKRTFHLPRFSITTTLLYQPDLPEPFRPNIQGSISWNLTPRWHVNVFSGYDFITRTPAYTRIRLTRDLHCWELHLEWIPYGFRSAYLISFQPRSPFLQDLRLQRRREWFLQGE